MNLLWSDLARLMLTQGCRNGSVAVSAMPPPGSLGSRYNPYTPAPSLHFAVFLWILTLNNLEGR